jgi:hypothetical protein
MRLPAFFALALLIVGSCRGPEIWIQQGAARTAVPIGHVEYLDSPPVRAHIVIGIITPPTGEYETLAEAVKAMRKEAAKRGADAVYIESQTKEGGWRFNVGGWGRAEGGSFSEVTFRAKAIVWK